MGAGITHCSNPEMVENENKCIYKTCYIKYESGFDAGKFNGPPYQQHFNYSDTSIKRKRIGPQNKKFESLKVDSKGNIFFLDRSILFVIQQQQTEPQQLYTDVDAFFLTPDDKILVSINSRLGFLTISGFFRELQDMQPYGRPTSLVLVDDIIYYVTDNFRFCFTYTDDFPTSDEKRKLYAKMKEDPSFGQVNLGSDAYEVSCVRNNIWVIVKSSSESQTALVGSSEIQQEITCKLYSNNSQVRASCDCGRKVSSYLNKEILVLQETAKARADYNAFKTRYDAWISSRPFPVKLHTWWTDSNETVNSENIDYYPLCRDEQLFPTGFNVWTDDLLTRGIKNTTGSLRDLRLNPTKYVSGDTKYIVDGKPPKFGTDEKDVVLVDRDMTRSDNINSFARGQEIFRDTKERNKVYWGNEGHFGYQGKCAPDYSKVKAITEAWRAKKPVSNNKYVIIDSFKEDPNANPEYYLEVPKLSSEPTEALIRQNIIGQNINEITTCCSQIINQTLTDSQFTGDTNLSQNCLAQSLTNINNALQPTSQPTQSPTQSPTQKPAESSSSTTTTTSTTSTDDKRNVGIALIVVSIIMFILGLSFLNAPLASLAIILFIIGVLLILNKI